MPAVSGSPTQLAASVTTLANLAGLPDDAYKDGDFAYVQSTRATYQLDRTSAATPSAVAVDAFSGNGQWVFFQASTSWETQATWYIDPAAGDDENDGETTTTALATWAEFTRRVKNIDLVMTVTLLSNSTESMIGTFTTTSSTSSLFIVGEPLVLASGGGAPVTTVFTNPVTATNTRGSVSATNLVTSAGVPTTIGAYVGKILRSPAISTLGPFAWPIFRDNAGVGEGGYWARPSSSNALPSADAVVEVLQLITVPTVQITAGGLPVFIWYLSFTATTSYDAPFVLHGATNSVTLVSAGTLVGPFFACQFAQALSMPSPTYFSACLWASGSTRTVLLNGASCYVSGGGSLAPITFFGTGTVTFQGFHVEGAKMTIGSSNFSGPIVVQNASSGAPIGIFNSTSDALEMIGTSRLSATTIYGSGSTLYGFRIGTGAQAQFTGTPTVTGTSGDLIFNGAATAIPPLTATAVVPAASALTTWVQWAAAPFSRNVFSYANGTKISGS